jgi:hypothetical protein
LRNYAWEIQIEAERRAVEFLDGLNKDKGGGDQRSKNHSRTKHGSDYRQELEVIGISDRDASRWRDIREVP